MKVISLVIFTVVAFSGYSDGSMSKSEAQIKFDVDKRHFFAFLNEINGTGYQMGSAFDMMWPKVQQIVPETVRVPGVEIFDPLTDTYMCATTTTIQPKLGELLDKKVLYKSKDRIVYDIEAELLLDSKAIEVGIAKSTQTEEKPSPLVNVSYLFKDPCRVKLIIEVQNFLEKEHVLVPECMMKVKSLIIDGVSEPETLTIPTDESSRMVEDYFRQSYKSDSSRFTGTVGLVKAVNEYLQSHPTFWVCSSKHFDFQATQLHRNWDMTENYNRLCIKKNILL